MRKTAGSEILLVLIFVGVGIGFTFSVYNSHLRFPRLFWVKDKVEHWAGDREMRKLDQELERERERRQDSRQTIADYKVKYGKDYALALKADLDEFKQERGMDEFRAKFDYDFYEYEVYEEKPLAQDPWSVYEDIAGTDILDREIEWELGYE